MAVTTAAPLHRLTIEDVYAMVGAGIIEENERVELVEGVLVDLNPTGAEHRGIVKRLTKHFVLGAGDRYDVAIQDMLLTSDAGYRLPDVVVTVPLADDVLPDTALLVIEVAQSSHARDREKRVDYAAIGVREYWIVDALADAIAVHTDPVDGVYTSVVEHREGTVTSLLEGVPPIALDHLFGRA